MISLKFGIISVFCLAASTMFAEEESYDLEKVTTAHGRVYYDILILDADSHGLLFRHRKGIAKIEFSQLSMNLQMLYQAVEEPEPLEEVAEGGEGQAGPAVYTGAIAVPSIITAYSRISNPAQWLGSLYPFPGVCRRPVAWPSHWPRYHPAHALAFPACRELAVRDFLYTTNLSPKPPGVCSYSLPRHGPYSFR